MQRHSIRVSVTTGEDGRAVQFVFVDSTDCMQQLVSDNDIILRGLLWQGKGMYQAQQALLHTERVLQGLIIFTGVVAHEYAYQRQITVDIGRIAECPPTESQSPENNVQGMGVFRENRRLAVNLWPERNIYWFTQCQVVTFGFALEPVIYFLEVSLCQGPYVICLLYTSPSPRDATLSRMPSSA